MVPTIAKFISALKKGVRRGEPTYVATLRESPHDADQGPLPESILQVLEEFQDVMPKELPKSLPPRRGVDHEIELVPGAKPPARAPYRMAPSELAELRKQLDELLESGFIRPSKV